METFVSVLASPILLHRGQMASSSSTHSMEMRFAIRPSSPMKYDKPARASGESSSTARSRSCLRRRLPAQHGSEPPRATHQGKALSLPVVAALRGPLGALEDTSSESGIVSALRCALNLVRRERDCLSVTDSCQSWGAVMKPS